MRPRLLSIAIIAVLAVPASVTAWIAYPTNGNLSLTPPLTRWSSSATAFDTYATDFKPLAEGFIPQEYRSFCGPASISTVLRAYGNTQADQRELFSSLGDKLDAFYTGMTLAELQDLAEAVGLRSKLVYADRLSQQEFRDSVKLNLQRPGDFVLINYDRRVLHQSGAGHISAIGAYEPQRDAFLVLDQASFKYPFTWIPAALLYDAMRTRDGRHYRGVLFIQGYDTAALGASH